MRTVRDGSEVVVRPPFERWEGLVAPIRRDGMRRELLDAAYRYSTEIGLDAPIPDSSAPVIVCGHQAEMQHPGISVKSAAASVLAVRIGGAAVNVVVDTDSADRFGARVPSGDGDVMDVPLLEAGSALAAGYVAVPDEAAMGAWLGAIERAVGATGSFATGVAEFATGALRERGSATSLADWATRARRRFERLPDGGSVVLELPVSRIMETAAWAHFIQGVVEGSERFVAAYNDALAAFRVRHRTRSAAQPFPDLTCDDSGECEAPFWLLDGGERRPVTFGGMADASAAHIAPKAVTLSLFLRSYLADLAIHGTGGDRYDEVTDEVASGVGLEPLAARVCATADVLFGWSMDPGSTRERSEVLQDLDRVRHHPETWVSSPLLGEDVRMEARSLLEEKSRLVADIGAPGADRKAMGLGIKEVNARIASMLDPVLVSLEQELGRIDERVALVERLDARTFSYPVFDPIELAAFFARAFAE